MNHKLSTPKAANWVGSHFSLDFIVIHIFLGNPNDVQDDRTEVGSDSGVDISPASQLQPGWMRRGLSREVCWSCNSPAMRKCKLIQWKQKIPPSLPNCQTTFIIGSLRSIAASSSLYCKTYTVGSGVLRKSSILHPKVLLASLVLVGWKGFDMKKAEGCSEPFSNRPFCNHCCVAASSHSFVCLGVETGGLGSMGRERSKKPRCFSLAFYWSSWVIQWLGIQFSNDFWIFWSVFESWVFEVISGFSSGSALVIMQLGLFFVDNSHGD